MWKEEGAAEWQPPAKQGLYDPSLERKGPVHFGPDLDPTNQNLKSGSGS